MGTKFWVVAYPRW